MVRTCVHLRPHKQNYLFLRHISPEINEGMRLFFSFLILCSKLNILENNRYPDKKKIKTSSVLVSFLCRLVRFLCNLASYTFIADNLYWKSFRTRKKRSMWVRKKKCGRPEKQVILFVRP